MHILRVHDYFKSLCCLLTLAKIAIAFPIKKKKKRNKIGLECNEDFIILTQQSVLCAILLFKEYNHVQVKAYR